MTKVNFHWLAQPNWKLFQQFDAIDGNHSIIVSQKKKTEMVCTRTLDPGRNNPPPKTGGPSNNNNNVVSLEARIAQMSRDMVTLIEQNLRLLERFPGG
jgi:hypothetical protein